MKRILILVSSAALALCLFGCGSGGSGAADSQGTPQEAPQQEEQKQPLDLTGKWTQTNRNSEDSYHEATIADGVITVDWITNGGDTKSLYWVGTYEPPIEATESYTWESANDHEQTEGSLLASSDDTKTFSYENGVLSYEFSALGSTTTVKMERG